MKNLRVCKEFTFDAAHQLPNYDGPCQRLHGHQWKLEVELLGPVDVATGMVLDFSVLKQAVNNILIRDLDHYYLNDKFDNPTAENMTIQFAVILEAFIRSNPEMNAIVLSRVRLYETPTSYCEWRRED